MPDAHVYRAELSGIIERSVVAFKDNAPDGLSELKDAKHTLREVEVELRSLKRRVIQEEKEIRAEAASAMGKAASRSHLVVHLLSGPAAASSTRARNKRHVSSLKDARLEPYRRVKLAIDDYLVHSVVTLRDSNGEVTEGLWLYGLPIPCFARKSSMAANARRCSSRLSRHENLPEW